MNRDQLYSRELDLLRDLRALVLRVQGSTLGRTPADPPSAEDWKAVVAAAQAAQAPFDALVSEVKP